MGGPSRARMIRDNNGQIPFSPEFYGMIFKDIDEGEPKHPTRSSTAIGSDSMREYKSSLFSKSSDAVHLLGQEGSEVRLAYEDGKPGSKTSLGKVCYALKKLPSLLLVDIDVTTEREEAVVKGAGTPLEIKDEGITTHDVATKKTREMVSSGRLRFQALREYIHGEDASYQSNHDFKGLIDQNEITFDLEARSNQLDAIPHATNIGHVDSPEQQFGRTNRIIIPVSDKETAEKVFEELKKNLELVHAKKMASQQAKKRDGKSDQKVTCTVVRKGVFLTLEDVKTAEGIASRETLSAEETLELTGKYAYKEAVTVKSAAETAKDGKAAEAAKREAAKLEKAAEDMRAKCAADFETTKYLYYHGLQLLFQHLCSSDRSRPSPAEHIIREDHFKDQNGVYRDAPWNYGLRYKPTCNIPFRIEYDIVPIVHDGKSVAEYASYFSPANLVNPTGSTNHSLKKLLSGLRVNYPFAADLRENFSNVASKCKWTYDDQTPNQDEVDELRQRTYTIRDIKSDSEVGAVIRVTPKDKPSPVFFTVVRYLSFFGKEPEKRYKKLPLADIGRTRPFWVPVYLLNINGDQALPHMHSLTEVMQDLRLSWTPQEVANKPPGLQKLTQNELSRTPTNEDDTSNKRIPYWTDGMEKVCLVLPRPTLKEKPSYKALETPPSQVSESGPDKREPLFGNFGGETHEIYILYVTSNVAESFPDSRASEPFLSKVKQALEREEEKTPDQMIVNIKKDNISAGTIKSGPEIFRLQTTQSWDNMKTVNIDLKKKDGSETKVSSKKNLELKSTISLERKVLIGVIDDHGMTRTKYDETAAEVKRLGDRKLGAVTVCLRKSWLESYFRRAIGEPYFPANVLGKIRYMLGHENYPTQELKGHLEAKYPEEIIVIGAHISQPSSEATEYCPAVAALVVTKPDRPSFYTPLVQIQPASETVLKMYDSENLPKDAWKLPRHKELYRPEIQDLKIMMKHAFEEWKKEYLKDEKRGGVRLEPRVVFYRDSYISTDQETFQKEADRIKTAYREVFGEVREVALSYVTAAKNPRSHSKLLATAKEDIATVPLSFTTSEYKETHIKDENRREEDAAKYQYIVHLNDAPEHTSKLNLGDLRTLTQQLNMSSQVSDSPSLALPIHYAQKLARRVLSYYDYLSHKDNSNNPHYARRTPFNAEVGNLHNAVMDGYLVTCTQRSDKSPNWDRVRKDNRSGWRYRPWHNDLDDKVFFL